VKRHKRKSFGYITAKLHGGRDIHKTVAIHFDRKDVLSGITFAKAILGALECEKGIDITIFKQQPLKSGKVRVTITAPK